MKPDLNHEIKAQCANGSRPKLAAEDKRERKHTDRRHREHPPRDHEHRLADGAEESDDGFSLRGFEPSEGKPKHNDEDDQRQQRALGGRADRVGRYEAYKPIAETRDLGCQRITGCRSRTQRRHPSGIQP